MTALSLSEVAKNAAGDEYTDYLVYKRLSESSRTKSPRLKDALSRLAETERGHYEFWKKYVSDLKIHASNRTIYLTLLFRFIFGMTFAVKYLENHESVVIQRYKSISQLIPEPDKQRFNEIVKDEQEHEKMFMNEMQSSYVKYISFVVLGLADAIVEISGIHAGSLGIYSSTELTGLAGIVAGASASIAMASAAYAQAKQGEFKGSPSISAVATGISYFVNAVILATPYFLTKTMSAAIGTSIVFAIIIIAFTSYYNSVVSEGNFKRDFAELAGIMLGASGALFVFGLLIRSVLGISI